MVILRRALENPIEECVVEEAKRLGMRSLKLQLRHDAGWPDRLWLLDKGRTFWTEFKRPGGPLEDLQGYRHKFLRSLGHDVAMFDDADAAIAALRERVNGQ
jgi:hypothetical protein